MKRSTMGALVVVGLAFGGTAVMAGYNGGVLMSLLDGYSFTHRSHVHGPQTTDQTTSMDYVPVTNGHQLPFTLTSDGSSVKISWDGQMYIYPAPAWAAYGYVAIQVDGVEIAQRYMGTNLPTSGVQYLPFHIEGYADNLKAGVHNYSLVYKAGSNEAPVYIDGRGYNWSSDLVELH